MRRQTDGDRETARQRKKQRQADRKTEKQKLGLYLNRVTNK